MSGEPRVQVVLRGRVPAPLRPRDMDAQVRWVADRLFPRGPVEVSVFFCGDTRMRALNAEWRGRRGTTDVLSFSMNERVDGRLIVGDIVISRDRARLDARRDGMTLAEKIRQLLFHGMLHLAGYDHEDPGSDARQMFAKTRALDTAWRRAGGTAS